ncbi:MAG: sulfatase-like hydrolase/transferase, partial [Planctomycetota bacterium]
RLARRGVSFTESYSTDPVCCPARSSLFTGRMSSETAVVSNSFPMRKDIPDLGQWLDRSGYETVYVGKWHIPNRNYEESFRVLPGAYGVGEHCDPAIARNCESYLLNRTGGKPFLLVGSFLNPHDICYWVMRNWGIPDGMRYKEIENELPPLPPNFKYDPREPEHLQKRRKLAESKRTGVWTERMWQYYIWSYYRQIEMVDACIGRILDALEDSGHADNTIILFTADHGDGHARHKMPSKSFLYDEAAKVPMMVSCPGRVLEDKLDKEHLVSGADMVPTLCDYAGVKPPAGVVGRSLRPLLEGKSVEWREFVAAESNITGRMIRTSQYKYITYKDDPVEQLFDMKNDPWETKNIVGESKYASVVGDHRKLLQEWSSKLDPAPEPPQGWQALFKNINKRQNKRKKEQQLKKRKQ